MPDGSDELHLKLAEGVASVDAAAWDACAGNPAYAGNPFIRYDFLHALEEANQVIVSRAEPPSRMGTTVAGLADDQVAIGDRYRIGEGRIRGHRYSYAALSPIPTSSWTCED